jgi:antitoxin CptB
MTPSFATASAALPQGAGVGASLAQGAVTDLGAARRQPPGYELIDERALSKLKWRCRRGLLENDLFIERFFKRFESSLTISQAAGLMALMDLSDNDLMDLHLSRKELASLPDAPQTQEAQEVLTMLRTAS